ncbi:MAG: hypothetical protein ACREUL_09820 [Steroidobacteraceae bacterium]
MRKSVLLWLCSCALALLYGLPPLRAAPAVSHDFDFALGTWRTRILHLQHSPGNADHWAVWSGKVVAAKVWGGRANIQEIYVNAPSGLIEEMRLCLYRPLLRQWYLYWADSDDGVLDKPMIGRFKGGVGSFYDQEDYDGRAIFVRHRWSQMTPRSYHWQQAFSDDGGRAWRANWNVTLTLEPSDTAKRQRITVPPVADPQGHGFDFSWGGWRTDIAFLPDPFASWSHWIKLRGQVIVRKIWGGRANLEEIEAKGPHGPFEGLTLRLYDSKARQWYLYWANSSSGVLDEPMIGSFKGGRGVFYNQDTNAGRTAFVRNVYFDVSADSYRFEQALSIDGGKTWRTNFVAHLTRERR